MASLADSFLADLEDLSGDESDEREQHDGEEMEADDVITDFSDLSKVAKLSNDAHYHDVMQRVRAALAADEAAGGVEAAEAARQRTGLLEDDPIYKLLVECNRLAVDIDNEIAAVHNFIRDHFRPQFPELESLVHHPLDYARVVQRIGTQEDLTLVELDDLLPAATVMVVAVTATTTAGRPLPPEAAARVQAGCDAALSLDADKAQIIKFVEGRMHRIAPNLSTVVGSEVAARLMGVAGGLVALSRMPACNVQVLGAKRRTLAGLSSTSAQPHQGFVFQCAIVQQTPPPLRVKAARLVAAKCTLMARVDAYGQDPTGTAGESMRSEVLAKIEKWQEPPPAKTVKPLPAPDAEKKKRRGGKRYRKMKEAYGMTEVRKAVNRVNFMQPEDEVLDGDEMVGLGVLGREGSGKLRVAASQTQKSKLQAKANKRFKAMEQKGGAVSGLASSLAFTPIQGIELQNPNAGMAGDDSLRSGTESYFSAHSGFRSIGGAGTAMSKK